MPTGYVVARVVFLGGRVLLPWSDGSKSSSVSLPGSMRRVPRAAIVVAGGLLAVVLLNLFWSDFVQREKTLYAWDHVAYWSLTANFVKGLQTDPVVAVAGVGRSLAEDELNLLPSIPLAPSLALFGNSRRVWILTVLNVYLVPALLLGWWVVSCWGSRYENQWDRGVGAWVWVGTILLFAPLWQPLALGYLGVGGLVLVFAVMGLALGPPSERSGEMLLRDLAIGILLAILIVFRRWFAFWSLSFCIIVVLGYLIAVVRSRKTGRSPFGLLRGPLTIGIGVVGSLVLLAGPRLATIVGTDYGDRFVHYKFHGSLSDELSGLVGHFGLLPLGLAALGATLLIRSKNTRMFAAGICTQLVLIAVLFRRIQDPSPQHWYLLVPGLMILTASGLTQWLSTVGQKKRRIAVGIVLLLGFVVSGQVFGAFSLMPSPIAPSVIVVPKVRTDLQEFERLMQWLDVRVDMGAQWAYVLAATGYVSDSSLAFTNFSLGTRAKSPAHILMTSQVDKRDGFPDRLMLADVVVLPLPIAVRGGGETQRVVEVPARMFLDGDGIAKAFVKIDEVFTFDDGVTAVVFERLRRNTPEEIKELSDRLKAYYPDRPEVWEPAE